MDDNLRQRYGQAVRQERFLRASSFVVDREHICGIDVLPLNIWHVMTLDVISSPFVGKSDTITADDVLNFLWLLQPKHSTDRLARRWFWFSKVRKLKADETIKAIHEFMAEAYQDAGGDGKPRASYYSSAAGLVDFIASQYGWSEASIIRVPLKRMFQYANAICSRLNPKAVLWNPSDKVRGEMLNVANQEQN